MSEEGGLLLYVKSVDDPEKAVELSWGVEGPPSMAIVTSEMESVTLDIEADMLGAEVDSAELAISELVSENDDRESVTGRKVEPANSDITLNTVAVDVELEELAGSGDKTEKDDIDSVTDEGMKLVISEYELTASNDGVRSEELANSEAVLATDEGPRSGK
ncbi:hypothetical protein LTS18_013980 [Coniosporium uncinatum]|uniref:Uncharacterized protein n=1 Tax=Coniosporium uncinatum TaxID=93489 RepID=A0ACC3DVF3_9PEZI|nr:hypothetical protein LTS18_013980 [Coniosporium uncinatum]